MHVLPLPFGLALALIPRREADRIRRRDAVRPYIRNAIRQQRDDRVVADMRYFRYL